MKYIGNFVEGKIIGEIPENTSYCDNMFEGYSSLIEAPQLPKSVVSCNRMFEGRSSLIKAPQLPEGVKSMDAFKEN